MGLSRMGSCVEIVEFSVVSQLLLAQAFSDDGQRFQEPRVVNLYVRVLSPEKSLQDPAAAHSDFHAPAAQVVEHTNLFYQPYWMMQGQDVNAGSKMQLSGVLRHRGQKHILGRGQAVHCGRVVLCEVIGVEPGLVQLLKLNQPLLVDLLQAQPRNGFNVVEDAELQRQSYPPLRSDIVFGKRTGTAMPSPRSTVSDQLEQYQGKAPPSLQE